MSYTMVVKDMHTHPGDDFLRHEALGNMIVEEQPDEIVFVGDFASLDSCSQHDSVRRCTMQEDREAIETGYDHIFSQMKKVRKYKPRMIFCEGNHEEREKRIRKHDPGGYASLVNWDEIMVPPDLFQEHYRYGQIVNVRGVDYTHCPLNNMGKAASMAWIRKHTARNLIWGHTHRMMLETIPQVGVENSVRGLLNSPALLSQNTKEHYCLDSTTGWTYGMLRVYPRGADRMFMFDYVDTEELETLYL